MQTKMILGFYVVALFLSMLVSWSITDLQYNQISDNLQRSVKNSVADNLIINRQTQNYYLDEEEFKIRCEELFKANANPNNVYIFEFKTTTYGATVSVNAETPMGTVNVHSTYIIEEREN